MHLLFAPDGDERLNMKETCTSDKNKRTFLAFIRQCSCASVGVDVFELFGGGKQ